MKSKNRKSTKNGRLSRLALALALVWLVGLAGCVGPSPLELDYGNSYHNNLAQSVLNPRAGLTDTPTVGLDPTSGKNEMENYNKSFTGEAAKKLSEMKVISSW